MKDLKTIQAEAREKADMHVNHFPNESSYAFTEKNLDTLITTAYQAGVEAERERILLEIKQKGRYSQLQETITLDMKDYMEMKLTTQ